MIEINKNSWIHRFNKAVSDQPDWWWDEQTNFCPYFWKTVKHFFLIALLGSFLIAAASLVGVLPLQEASNFGKNWGGIPLWKYLAAPFAGAATIIVGVSVFFSVAWLISQVVIGFRWLLFRKKEPRIKKQSWVSSMWVGFKHNYCPRMKVK